MSDVFEQICQWFDENQWTFQKDEEQHFFHCVVEAENKTFTLAIQHAEQANVLAVFAVFPVVAEGEAKQQMMEFVTRANYGLLLGNFELDLDDGEIRFKRSLDLNAMDYAQALFTSTVAIVVSTMDRYSPGIDSVLNNEPARTAIALVENP